MPYSLIIIVALSSAYSAEFQVAQVIRSRSVLLEHENLPVKLLSLHLLYHHPPCSSTAQWRRSARSLSRSLVLKNIPTWYDSESPLNRQHANESLFYKPRNCESIFSELCAVNQPAVLKLTISYADKTFFFLSKLYFRQQIPVTIALDLRHRINSKSMQYDFFVIVSCGTCPPSSIYLE